MALNVQSGATAGWVSRPKRPREFTEAVNDHEPGILPTSSEEPWDGPPACHPSDPNPFNFDVRRTAGFIRDMRVRTSNLMWICGDSESMPNEAPSAIHMPHDRDRKGAPFWAQCMDLAIHVLVVLLDAARNHVVIPPINIANYERKFLSPIEELHWNWELKFKRNSWTESDQNLCASIASFKIMLEVSEFMCITVPVLDFGEGVMAYADKLFLEIMMDRVRCETNWEPSHELKRMHMQDEWARTKGIEVWFPQTLSRLIAYSIAYDAPATTL